MGEVGDAGKEQAKGEGEDGEAGDAAGEVGGDGMGEAGAAIQVRNRFEFDVMFQYFYYI